LAGVKGLGAVSDYSLFHGKGEVFWLQSLGWEIKEAVLEQALASVTQ